MIKRRALRMNGQCKGLDFSYRLDRQPVQDWIKSPVDFG